MTTDENDRYDSAPSEGGPASRRRQALRRLRAAASRYRKRYWVAATLALVLGAAFALSAAGVLFESEREPRTLGTGRAGVMAVDSARVDTTGRRVWRQGGGVAAGADRTEAGEEAAEIVGRGSASYYGAGLSGNPTASGEPFDPAKLTAAHRTLPLGSRVRVTNLRNDETVTVRINDRGPFHGNRILDLSRRAAERLGMIARGEARVEIELLEEN